MITKFYIFECNKNVNALKSTLDKQATYHTKCLKATVDSAEIKYTKNV